MIGQSISHYMVIERLGGGGMGGPVYKAEDTSLHRFAALKFLPEELAKDPLSLARFQREAQAASALNHPNICTIYEIGQEDGKTFIAMEYLDGVTLKHMISGQPLPLETLLSLAIQVAEALDAAHAGGIVHRDIKPANIFVTKRGLAKVLDFGLAKIEEPRSSTEGSSSDDVTKTQRDLTTSGSTMGTVAYHVPGTGCGQAAGSAERSVLVRRCLVRNGDGRRPFERTTSGATFGAILHEAPISPSSWNAQLPRQLVDIIEKALQKPENLRYQHAAELRGDLEKLRRGYESGRLDIVRRIGATNRRLKYLGVGHSATNVARDCTFMAERVAQAHGMDGALCGRGAGRVLCANRQVRQTTEKDTVVLAHFENKTQDPVFDDTLRQALTVKLEQSPYLNILSERKAEQTLSMMGRQPDQPITNEIAREICQRVGSKATLAGTIVNLGGEYVVGLTATNCTTGDSLATEQARASQKSDVLKALDRAASQLRDKLARNRWLPSRNLILHWRKPQLHLSKL